MKKIVIYADQGTSPYSVHSIIHSLHLVNLDEQYVIEQITKDYFNLNDWQNTTALIIFPGGKDIPYHEALKGPPLRSIRQFVENGGKYFGICAGAYFGCRYIEFEKGGSLEVLGERELNFFTGKGIGPAYGLNQFSYQDESGAHLALLTVLTKDNPLETKIYFNGGCFFESFEENASIQTLARYQDLKNQPKAIIQCQIGKGMALLSGVHPEFSALHQESKQRMLPNMHKELLTYENARMQLFSDLINILLT